MGQGVHAGGSGQGGGLADHQHGIVDRDIGGAAPVDDGHLDLCVRVGDDAEAGHLRSSAGGGVDGDKGGHGFGAFVDALEVADVAAIADDQADPFGAVVGAAAAEGDNGVTAVVLIHRQAVVNVLVGGIRLGAVENDDLDAGRLDLLLDLVGHPHGRDPLVGDQQGLGAAEGLDLVAGLLGAADAHERNGRNEKSESLICQCHCVLSFLG